MPIPDPIPFSGRPDQVNPGAIPPHFLTTQPQSAPPTQYASQIEVRPVFDRLKWSILDPLSGAQIVGVDAQGEPQLQPFFEGPESASAEEPATEPPNARLHIVIEPLNSWHQWRDKKHLKPASGLIEHTGGRPISVKQFMQAIRDYAAPMRKLLCQSMDIDSLSDIPRAKFYFDLIMGGGSKDPQRPFPQLQVHVLKHPTGEGDRSDLDWKSLNNRFG
ncbi:hypothetical protein BS50DRAFT_570116 [Corynespora cassiicola Philippines]|uniref:Uncharacterized protein n=1 Tax=Corynespora cassiicola Philippines TaxID=1448308 RepID=A0A2T2NYS2_CORCC|nr:hypothetical protein BS50DRAFT_570116 [Corynespora cassiicola Philippines]